MKKKFKLFSDGASRGNPGMSASSYFLFRDDELLDFGGRFIGESTNNVAEYTGLIMGLKATLKLMVRDVECFLDSELVVKQLNGNYKVNDLKMKSLFNEVEELKSKFEKINFHHIPRSQNAHADKLVNLLLDNVK